MKKENLPTKTCTICKRPFTWRKKWKLNWHRIKYCSKKCSGLKYIYEIQHFNNIPKNLDTPFGS